MLEIPRGMFGLLGPNVFLVEHVESLPRACRGVKVEAARVDAHRRRIRASPVAFEIVVNQRPARVVIDPYYKLIDRDRGDTVRAVLSAGAQAGR